jgi:hypothetical protein
MVREVFGQYAGSNDTDFAILTNLGQFLFPTMSAPAAAQLLSQYPVTALGWYTDSSLAISSSVNSTFAASTASSIRFLLFRPTIGLTPLPCLQWLCQLSCPDYRVVKVSHHGDFSKTLS